MVFNSLKIFKNADDSFGNYLIKSDSLKKIISKFLDMQG